MSEKISFSKAVIESVNRKSGGGTVKISCVPTETVGEIMKWGDPPEWQTGANLIGELNSSIVEFKPTHSDLEKLGFELRPAELVYGFHTVRKQIKKGKGAKTSITWKTELHFSVDFTDPEGAGFCEKFMLAVNACTVRVTYTPEAVQETIPGMQDEKQGKLEGMVEDIAKKRAKDVN